jgi:hypothetical protein
MKPTISKPFKSNDRTFEKVFGLFNKKDYFNVKGLAKVQIGNFERALQKNDKNAQQVLDMFKGDDKKAKEYIIQVIHDRKKEQAFNDYKALKDAVDSIQKGKPNVGAVDYVKRIIHNNNQKYSIALYSAISGKRINNYKDIHKDIDSSINEAYIVLYSPKKGVKPVSTAAYKDKKDAEKWAKDLGGVTMIVKKKVKGIDEGKKRYNQKDGVGKSKYVISYHDGKKKHKDGSDFFDIQIFRNKKDLAKFVNTLHKGGYVYGFNESVNEASKLAMGIAGFTGTRGAAVDDFIQKHKIDAKKLFNFVKKGNLKDRMAFVAAIAGRPNNKMFKMITKQFSESTDGVPQGYNPIVEAKNKESKVIEVMYKYSKTEKKFYDKMAEHERRIGPRDYAKFIIMALKGFGINPRQYKRIPDAEEKLYQTVAKK